MQKYKNKYKSTHLIQAYHFVNSVIEGDYHKSKSDAKDLGLKARLCNFHASGYYTTVTFSNGVFMYSRSFYN